MSACHAADTTHRAAAKKAPAPPRLQQLLLLADRARLIGDAPPMAKVLDAGVRLHQAEFAGVFGTEEEIQVAVAAGTPVRPSMRPVRPPEIASVIAENLHGARLARLLSRIKNELRAAIGSGGGFREGGIRFLFPPLHMTAGLEKK